MRIGIDCRTLQEPRPSGVSVYTRELLHALVALPESSQHTFVCFLNGAGLRNGALLAYLQKEIPQKNIEWRVRTVPNKFITAGEMLFGAPKLAWMFGEVDVVFVPNIAFFPIADRSVPLVLTVHDLSFERFPEYFSPKGRLWHRLLHPRKFVERANHVVTVSHHTQAEVMDVYGVPNEKITPIYPGAVKPIQSDTPLPIDVSPYILFLATVEPRKNVDALIEAFYYVQEQIPDVHLIIAGGRGWKADSINWKMKESTGVHYIEYVDEQTKWQLLKNAAVFVYPSLYEGFGFPPLEAQSVGVPVVVGNHTSLPEVLGNSALYADVLDVNSLARSITHMVQDEQLRQHYVAEGYKNIQRFSWERSARELLAVLTTVR